MTPPGRPSVGLRLSGGEVLLGPEGVRVLRAALGVLHRSLARDGIGLPPAAQVLLALAGDAATATADSGSAAVPLSLDPAGSVLLDPVSSQEAAVLLHCKPRNARDLCRRGVFPSARLVDGRWLLERADVLERVAA